MVKISITITEVEEGKKDTTTFFDLSEKQTRKLVGQAGYCNTSLKVVFNYLLDKALEDAQVIAMKSALDNMSGKGL